MLVSWYSKEDWECSWFRRIQHIQTRYRTRRPHWCLRRTLCTHTGGSITGPPVSILRQKISGQRHVEVNMLTDEETEKFQALFSKYCRGEINKSHCSDGDCEFCPVNSAHEQIFHSAGEAGERKNRTRRSQKRTSWWFTEMSREENRLWFQTKWFSAVWNSDS